MEDCPSLLATVNKAVIDIFVHVPYVKNSNIYAQVGLPGVDVQFA